MAVQFITIVVGVISQLSELVVFFSSHQEVPTLNSSCTRLHPKVAYACRCELPLNLVPECYDLVATGQRWECFSADAPVFLCPNRKGWEGGGRGSLACLMYMRPHRTLLDAVDTFLLGTLCPCGFPKSCHVPRFMSCSTVYYPLEGDAHHVHPGFHWLMSMSTHGRAWPRNCEATRWAAPWRAMSASGEKPRKMILP